MWNQLVSVSTRRSVRSGLPPQHLEWFVWALGNGVWTFHTWPGIVLRCSVFWISPSSDCDAGWRPLCQVCWSLDTSTWSGAKSRELQPHGLYKLYHFSSKATKSPLAQSTNLPFKVQENPMKWRDVMWSSMIEHCLCPAERLRPPRLFADTQSLEIIPFLSPCWFS